MADDMVLRWVRVGTAPFITYRNHSLKSKTMLYVSFWNLALSNLPVGKFSNSVITTLAAAALISSARAEGNLFCVSADDLLAPYKKQAYQAHADLCAGLREESVEISIDDFIGSSANPLSFALVDARSKLIVVNCAYTLDLNSTGEGETAQRLRFEIARDSITFHLIQQCDPSSC